ncbi:hypothetical protein Q3G72_017464 [Acer saccharum]|nr:hypothetical protein Q3G72_017464 [Acer saccharum]
MISSPKVGPYLCFEYEFGLSPSILSGVESFHLNHSHTGWKMSFLEEDGTNLNYNVDLNEVGQSQLHAADNNVGYNMQNDSNQTYLMSEDSYPVLFSTDNTTTIPSIFSDVPVGPSDADDSAMEMLKNSTPSHIIQIARYGALSARANRMCYLVSKSTEGYKDAKVAIDNLTIQMQGLLPSSSTQNKCNLPIHDIPPHVHVKDPVAATTKGGVRQGKKSGGKTRHCGRCRKPGHTAKTCVAPAQHICSAMGSNEASFKTMNSIAPSFDTSQYQNPNTDCMMDSVEHSQSFSFPCNEGSTVHYNNMRNGDVMEASNINASMYMQQNRWWGPTHFI